jgi:hypothetical protein
MRVYRILKVTDRDEQLIAVISRDYADSDAWAVIERFPPGRRGLDQARAYVLKVQQHQADLEGDT